MTTMVFGFLRLTGRARLVFLTNEFGNFDEHRARGLVGFAIIRGLDAGMKMKATAPVFSAWG